MKFLKTARLPCALIPVICMLACGTQTGPQAGSGSLVLSIGCGVLRARTIVPAVTMEIATFDIQGTGPEAATFGGTGLRGDTYQWDELAPGQWIVTVNACNGDGIRIATATKAAVIVGGETTQLALTVVPLAGPGTLAVSISWPGSLIASPVVSASLTPDDGNPAALEFTVGAGSASWSSSDLDAGYYTLSVQLRDGNALVWGRTEAARILAGQTASVLYPLTEVEINGAPTGTLALQVTADLMNPLGITLSGVEALLPFQSQMTVTAHADVAADSWQWYLNGEPMSGATHDILTIAGTVPPGKYWLDVVGKRGTVLSSAHAFFTVVSQPPVAAPAVGEVVINEIMMDPAGVADTSGEWFELYNKTARPLDLQGLVVRTASQFVRVAGSGTRVVVQPGDFFVLCRNGDPAVNGQVVADYTYGSGITLPNGCGSLSIAEFGTNGMDGTVIDAMQWTSSVGGKSWSLKSQFRNATDNDVAANWYWSSRPYSSTDMGTPGAANEQ